MAFRRAADDGVPVMVLPLGERQAAVPLVSLQRELEIDAASADGRMLGLIAEALEYVPDIAIGDALPSEVVTGEASWQPAPHHLWIAAARLRMALLRWLQPGDARDDGPVASLQRVLADPAARTQVQAGFEQAALALRLASAEQVVERIDSLAFELSHIEALRERLLGRVQALVRRLASPGLYRGVDLQRCETLQQVGRLSVVALGRLREDFEEIDGQTAAILPLLRAPGPQTAAIRSHRNRLYRASRDWAPLLDDWDRQAAGADDGFWALMGRTYHFLAPRYRPSTQWRRQPAAETVQDRPAAMVW